MRNSPFISVIINCYNGEKYLREAIDSVFAQTFIDWELILWDNQSRDSTREVFESYNDDRLRYFLAPCFTSLGSARNHGVDQAVGEWIAFLDCDDYWLPDKLNEQINLIDRESSNDNAIIYSNIKTIFMEGAKDTLFARRLNNKSKNISLPSGKIFHKLLLGNFIPLSSALIKKDAYTSLGGIDKKYKFSEDYDLFVKIAKSYTAVWYKSESSIYRMHDTNMSQLNIILGYNEARDICRKYFFNIFAIIGYLLYSLKIIYVKINNLIK